MKSHLEAALEYAEKSWPVFPCQTKGKKPRIPGSFHKATIDHSQIEIWWRRWPEANIGIPCGEQTFCVVDVDSDKGGEDSFIALREEYGTFPETLVQLTGGGGAHYCFQHDKRIGESQSKIAQGIDTRGDNKGYIIVAPSVHPNGKLYKWENPGFPLGKIPEWFVELLQQKRTPVPPARRPQGNNNNAVIERARKYLQECEPAVQGSGGHDKLLWACSCMVHGFELDDNIAYELLAGEFNPRCTPPWDLGNPQDLKEFKRKIQEGRKEKTKPRGWLLDDMKTHGRLESEHGKQIQNALLASVQRDKVEEPEPEEEPAIEISIDLLQPVGLLGDIVSFINRGARKPQPLLAVGAALTFCGTLFGQKIRDEWNLRTNIYALGVAESCSGKDHARKAIKEICYNAGIMEDILGGEKVTSEAAIMQRVEEFPNTLFLWDEIGLMFARLKHKNASSAQTGIIPFLMELFTSANTMITGKQYADRQRKSIDQPNVSIYGTTVPRTFYDGLTSVEIEGGLLGRFLVFCSTNDDPDTNYESSTIQQVPEEIIKKCQEWVTLRIPPPPDTPELISRMDKTWQITVPTNLEAQKILAAFGRDMRKKRKKALGEGSAQAALWGRGEEHARRVALIVATGDAMTPEKACIEKEHANWACQFIFHLLKEFIKTTKEKIADSEEEMWVNRILSKIKATNAKGIAKRDLTRKTQKAGQWRRNACIADLLEAERIVQGKRSNVTYYYCPPHGLTS